MISGPQSSYSPLSSKVTSASTTANTTAAASTTVSQQTTVVNQNTINQNSVSALSLGDIWTSIKNAVVSLWDKAVSFVGKLFGKKETVDPQVQQIATQYSLFPTAENVNAFLTEVKAYETNGTVGPGCADTAMVKELQAALKKLGYTLDESGSYDEKTSEAVMKFKRENNLHQTYKNADGTWAVNQYLDPQTVNVLATKLQGGTTPTTTTDPGTVDYAAIAQQYGLLNTQDNVKAFLAEAQSYENGGALGPDITAKKDDIVELQQILKALGQPVAETGVYDQATCQGVIAYKKANNLHQNYKTADGNWAVNEYADLAILEAMLKKVESSTTAATTTTPAAAAATTTPTSIDVAGIAQQYGLLATKENVEAFIQEAGTYESGGALGPGSTDTDDIKDLQQILKTLNFSVTVTGSYDDATSKAVVSFKQQNGIHQNYKLADGNWAINEFADSPTLKAILDKLG